ncbi:MAG TPA: alanine--tRNA ligase, partial [Gaiellales bacterium]|nr:alanine--tRNA ligase [Gaiellales bacterium]
MRSHEIRRRFLDHFAGSGHLQLPSGSLVPPDWDRSVLITTAGMQPLKRYFLGLEEPPQARLMTVQKVFRTVDIDEVGRTAHHLTFFEMLGNFSIGDYFKRFAVEQAWQLVTSEAGWGFDPDRLWASVYEGDGAEIPPDEEAIALWLEVGVPAERIVRLGSDNFWQAGPVGPCGPCSELHYDRGPEFGCGRAECGPDCDCDRFIEFWNLVFMQYNMLDDGSLEPLPSPSIDTGAGLERVTMLSEGVESAYLTDAFADVIAVVEEWSGARYGHTPEETKALKVLADHGRAMSFLASDGIEPGNEGRGYVLRRVIRRAVRSGRQIGIDGLFLARLHQRVVELLGEVHPELRHEQARVAAILKDEEVRFTRTLEAGQELLDDILATSEQVSGADAFRLHDTYGFPIELTVEIAAEHHKSVDEAGFESLMEEQRDRARAAITGTRVDVGELDADFQTAFVGYERLDVTTQIGALHDQGDGSVLVKLRESPFYPKGGGQVADTGWIETESARAAVEDVVRLDDDQVIVVRIEHGELHRGERVRARVDAEARRPTMANHTATHLLHAALRGRLGDHVTQAGSYVGPDKLRFDFRHSAPLSPDELADVERVVNEHVIANHPLHVFVTSRDHAGELGAMMLFGEKYGEHVRVVEIPDVSRELCGGTHVRSTAEIGPFVVTRETSSSQGIRRIEAVTAGAGLAHLQAGAREAEALRSRVSELEAEVKRAARAAPAGGNGNVAGLIEGAGEEAGVRIVAAVVADADGDQLLQLSDTIRSRLSPSAVVLGGNAGGKAHLVASFDGGAQERGLS